MTSPESVLYGSTALTRFRYGRRLRVVRRCLGARLNPGARVCDLGCGDGAWLRFIEAEVGRGVGVDLGWSGAFELWKGGSGRIELIPGDFMEVDLGDAAFDVVTCLETLEHVARPGEVIRRMHDLLEPGGMAVASIPIEIGPSLVVKEVVARLVRYRRTASEAGRWRWPEIARAALGDVRAVEEERERTGRFDHKGFDHREIERTFRAAFADVRVRGTPFPPLGGVLNVGLVLSGIRAREPTSGSSARRRPGRGSARPA